MKTKKLPMVPAGEPGDFYYHHLRLPYANYDPAHTKDFPFEPDPTVEEVMDVSSEGEQIGFVILRKDNAVELIDTLTGEHIRVSFGPKKKRHSKQHLKNQRKQKSP